MYFLLCAIGHGSAVLLCSGGEISLLCSVNLHNLVAQTSTFQLFKQHSIIAHFQRGSVAEEGEEGGGAGGTNLLFFRDGKLDICAPVSVFTATAGKYAAHFMDT